MHLIFTRNYRISFESFYKKIYIFVRCYNKKQKLLKYLLKMNSIFIIFCKHKTQIKLANVKRNVI